VLVVGEAADGEEAIACAEAVGPEVMLLDLRMPHMDGISTLEALQERRIDVKVLVLTTFDDADLVLTAMRAGARGYLLKDVTLEQLVAGIRAVASGEAVLQPALTERLLRSSPMPSAFTAGAHDALTARELEVLRLVAGGYSNREIAELLHLAEGTIKNHVSSILLKFGVRDRTQAVLRALHEGVLG